MPLTPDQLRRIKQLAAARYMARRGKNASPNRFNRSKWNRVIVPGDGPPCPRCRRPMQIREHRHVTAHLARKPYYFRRWYYCTYQDCKTEFVMPNEFKVFND